MIPNFENTFGCVIIEFLANNEDPCEAEERSELLCVQSKEGDYCAIEAEDVTLWVKIWRKAKSGNQVTWACSLGSSNCSNQSIT